MNTKSEDTDGFARHGAPEEAERFVFIRVYQWLENSLTLRKNLAKGIPEIRR